MPLSLTVILEDRHQEFSFEKSEILIGRAGGPAAPDIDLGRRAAGVSWSHCRIFERDGVCWVEDLQSVSGTRVGGREIHGLGECNLALEEVVEVGGATMWLVESRGSASAQPVKPIDATVFRPPAGEDKRLKMLYELPLEIGAETNPDSVLQHVAKRLVEVLPGQARAGLLLSEELILKGHYPWAWKPSASLALRAMRERTAFIWRRAVEECPPGTIAGSIEGSEAMYAPLLWRNRSLGVLCAHQGDCRVRFSENDLRFIVTVAQYASVAVVNEELRRDLQDKARLLERLLTNFSPKVRDKLLEKARGGRLRPGGERSEVTILCSDMRGFTQTTAGLEADEVVELLNDYLPVLTRPIFEYDGTVDKYMGDAILAVFGSPERDPQHPEKALRCGVEMQAAVRKLNEQRGAAGRPICQIGIGIHSGVVLHGFIGTLERLEFTVVGDTVNAAQRYCQGAAGGEVMISPAVHERVWRMVAAERATIPTKHEGEWPAYRVKSLKQAGGVGAAGG